MLRKRNYTARKTAIKIGILTSSLLLPLLACHKTKPDHSQPSAITNRPQKEDAIKFILVKLNSPALLEHAKVQDSRVELVEAEKKAIIAEQATFIDSLKKISDDIKVIYQYQLLVNAVYIVAPKDVEEHIKELPQVSSTHNSDTFARPMIQERYSLSLEQLEAKMEERNSTRFIGAQQIKDTLKIKDPNGQDLPIDGRGMKVGVIDTGIDYTHAMFGGVGSEEAYKSIDPNIVTPSSFPTAKVVGGIDLVGTDYNDASLDIKKHIPQPDANPIDEAGHGTHVAGTIAGVGDYINTYTGIADKAQLYAIKVFGKDGSTGDATVLAALEYALDPNHDLNLDDKLDVVNLSLGSSFGLPHTLYNEAISRLSKAQVTAVISAGNSGNISYIVGAPGTSNDALSVAASVDDADHNWKFKAVRFVSEDGKETLEKAIEGSLTKPISSSGAVIGALVYAGLADKDFSPELKAAIKGNIALIDRGAVAFAEKVSRAVAAEAIGVVVVNNSDGEPIHMGGDGSFDIPGIMIRKALGDEFKKALADSKKITLEFSTDKNIENPELIDTLASFSSRGPRSIDARIKPEISAPGSQIISAQMGGGAAGVAMSGTSMAAPHMAGVVTLLKQYRKGITDADIKDRLLSTTKLIHDKDKQRYSIAQQGAGRVEAYKALTSSVIVSPAALSLGEISLDETHHREKTITLKNTSDQELTLYTKKLLPKALDMKLTSEITLAAHSEKTLDISIKLKADYLESPHVQELSGFIEFSTRDQSQSVRLSTLAVVKRVSGVMVSELKIASTSILDAEGAKTEGTLNNSSRNIGRAYLFNLLAKNERRLTHNQGLAPLCDLESVGYRVIHKTIDGNEKKMLQIAAKLYSPLSNWQHCEISVQMDVNEDGISDQELVGGNLNNLSPRLTEDTFGSALTSAKEMRRIRAELEANGGDQPADYSEAIIDLAEFEAFNHSTLAILNVDLSKMGLTQRGLLRVKVAVLSVTSDYFVDEYLNIQGKDWFLISPYPEMQSYYGMSEIMEVQNDKPSRFTLSKGEAQGDLIAYFPDNLSQKGASNSDHQSQIVKPIFIR